MEGGKRWWRVAQGGGGWHKVVEDGEREGDKFYRCFSTTTAAFIGKSELAAPLLTSKDPWPRVLHDFDRETSLFLPSSSSPPRGYNCDFFQSPTSR